MEHSFEPMQNDLIIRAAWGEAVFFYTFSGGGGGGVVQELTVFLQAKRSKGHPCG